MGLARRDWPGSPNLQAACGGEEDGQIARNVVRFQGRRQWPAGNDKRKRQSKAKRSVNRPRREYRARQGAVMGELASCRFSVVVMVMDGWVIME